MSSLSSVGSSSASPTLAGLSTSGISFQGLASGLDTDQLIQGLLAPEQQVITNLQNQQAQIKQQETTYTSIQSSLIALQSALSSLSPTTSSVFDGRTASSSNTSVATASATSGASAGVYSFTVNSLAQAQIISSQGFDAASSTITQGTFQFQVGSGAVNTVTINNTNNTLQGLASAIDALDAGVTASVVNDGSTSQGSHLVLTSNNTGTANAITITNNLAASSGSAMRPELSSTYVGDAVTSSGWSGTATPVSNSGSGSYTGTSNDTFTFTVTNGGKVNAGATTIAYSNTSGTITGTINGSAALAGSGVSVAEGINLSFSGGGASQVVTGQTFTIKGFTPSTQAASNASVTLGSGSGGLTVSNSTNTFQNLFSGITVNAVGTSASPVTITVANNAQAAATSINSFVSAYNQVVSFIDQNDSFNAQTGQAGILLGDYHATSIMNGLGRVAGGAVSGVNQLASDLGQIGITVNADGTLAVNNTTLTQALNGQLSGVSANDVRRLFVQDAASSNSQVSFVFAPSSIQAVGSPISVNITQAATQGAATGSNTVASSTTISSSNNTFSVTVDGHSSGALTLASGTYTQAQLAQQVQAVINASPTLAGAGVTAAMSGNNLVLTSNTYGSHSQVTIGTGNALSALGFSGTESGTGQDVAGTFTYDGTTESATGSGQVLTGSSTNKFTGGLAVLSTLTPAQITGSAEGTVTVTQGIAAQLGNVLNRMLDPVSGQITLANQSLQSQSDSIGKSILHQQQQLAKQQQQLLEEFTNMETVLAQLQSAANSLGSSLTGFTAPGSSSSSSTSK